MALQKAVKQENGIILNYHRIADITNIINDKTQIKIYSYINEEERQKEFNQPKYSPYKQDIYKITSYEDIKYNDTLTAEQAYDYLKMLDKYKNSINV